MPAVAPAPDDFRSWQESLDFLLPRKELLRPDEVAAALGLDERTVLRMFEEGRLHGHEFNAASGQRQHRRYRRASVILLLASRANYAPDDILARILEVIAQLPRSQKAALYQALGRALAS